jgi:hypothetical protein
LKTMPDYSARHGEQPITPDGGTSPLRSDRRSFDTTEDTAPNYLMWFFVILLAVILGNLVSTYITAKIVEYRMSIVAEQAVRQMGEVARQSAAALQQMQERSAQQQAQQTQLQRQQRAASPTGTKLERECSERTQNHVQTKSTYAATERNKRCGQLQHYIDTGAVPR